MAGDPANLVVVRSTSFFTDNDESLVYDPGDVLYTRVTITNDGDEPATGVSFYDNFSGLTIVAGTLNISPIASSDSFTAIGNTVLRVGTVDANVPTIGGALSSFVSGNLLTNDRGALSGPNSFAEDSIKGFQIIAASGTSANGGVFNVFGDGSFNYLNDGTDPTLTFDTFTYTIEDAGLDNDYATKADNLTSVGTVTITFNNRVWYVDPNAAANGDGTSLKPFQNVDKLNGVSGDVDAANEFIYVKSTVTGALPLEAGQSLIGTGAALVVGGVTLAGATASNSTITAPTGTIVTLAGGGTGNNTIAGINIGNNSGTAAGIVGNNFGTLTVNNATIDAVGQALNLTTGTVNGTGFTSTSSDGGVQNVLTIDVNGTLALGTGILTGATGNSISINGGNVALTYGGDISNGSGTGAVFRASGASSAHTGSATLTGTLTATSGAGFQFDNADGTYNIAHNGTSSVGSATINNVTNGVNIANGSAGTFNFGTGVALQTASSTTFAVAGGNGNINFHGTITDDQGQLVKITGRTGGTIDFNGLVTDGFDGDGGISTSEGSIHVSGNTGGTVRFDGGVHLSTGANDALTATGNSNTTLVITDPSDNSNKIATGAGQAIDVQSTTIGTGGLVFESINVTGNNTNVGINLNNTGNTAGLTVTGTGAAGTGGTIQNTAQGATFTSTSNVSLTNMNFTNANHAEGTVNNIDAATFNSAATAAINLSSVTTATFTGLSVTSTGGAGSSQVGINGNVVSNLTLTNSTVSGYGDEAAEGAVKLWNLTGTANVTGSTFGFAAGDTTAGENLFEVRNGSGTSLTLNMSGNTFNTTRTSTNGSGGIALTTGGTATMTANISNNDFFAMKTSGVEVFARDSSTLNVNITNGGNAANGNVFDRQAGLSRAIGLNAEDSAILRFNVLNNTISGSGGPIVNLFGINNAQIEGRINANTITGGGSGSVGSPIFIHPEDSANAIIEVKNNVITQVGEDAGISVISAGDGAGPSTDDATLDITIANNNITLTTSAGGTVGIDVRSGPNATDVTKTAANVTGNTVNTVTANDVAFLTRIGSTGSNLYLQGNIAGADNNTRATNNWNSNGNTEVGAGTAVFAFDAAGAPAYANPPAGAPYNGAVRVPTHPMMAEAPPAAAAEDAEPIDGGLYDDPVVDNSEPAPAPQGASQPAPAAPVVIDDGVLSEAELAMLVEAAIQRWAAAGASEEQVAAMRAVSVSVSDLGGLTLGASGAGTIAVDSDAAGWRWFVDPTPGDDSEYAGSGTRLTAANAYGHAGTRIDLLTVLTHELGHQIGLSDSYSTADRDELMYGTITAGERRLPGGDDLAGAGGSAVAGAFAIAPISLGTIAPGQVVTIEWRATVTPPAGEDRLLGYWVGTSFADSNETSEELSNSEGGNYDSLSLGNLVYTDVNKNGVFDGTDSGIAGVTLALYGDTNDNGVYDAGDLYVGYTEVNNVAGFQHGVDTPAAPGTGTPLTTVTDANGFYTFTGLAPGDYIVRVEASNFGAGVLGTRLAHSGAPDPDDADTDNDINVVQPGDVNIDHDNNAQQFLAGQPGTYAATRAIRLDYGQEPTSGVGNDTNNTLDIGFDQPNLAPSGTSNTIAIVEDAGAQTLSVANFGYSDSDGNALLEIKVNSVAGGTLSVNGTAVTTYPATITPTQLTANEVVFTPTEHFNGAATINFQVRDDGGTANGGVDTDQSANVLTFDVSAVNDPVTTAAPSAVSVTEDTPKAITGLSIADVDAGFPSGAAGVYVVTLSSTNGTMSMGAGTLAALTFSAGDGTADSTMTFRGTLANINTALATATYSPASNYNGSAQIQLQATDTYNSIVATGTGVATNDSDTVTVTVDAVNDAPTNTVGAAININEDAGAITVTGMTVADTEATGDVAYTLSVEHGVLNILTNVGGGIEASDIQAVAGTGNGTGTIVIKATIAQINATLGAAGGLTYTAAPHYNGADTLTAHLNDLGQTGADPGGPAIDSSNAATSEEDLDARTINIAAVNDAPVVPDSPGITVTEGTTSTLNPALAVSDVDLDARNGGNGDYGGAQFLMNRSGGANAQDQFILSNANAVGFTVTGTILGGGNLQSGGLTFGNWNWNGAGLLTVNFTSAQTAATTALVNAVLQAVQYNIVSDTPPASVNLVYTLNDGSPGGGQGSGATNIDGGAIALTITATNDGPWLDLDTTVASTDVAKAYTENGGPLVLTANGSVVDPDLGDFDGGVLNVQVTANANSGDRLTIVDLGVNPNVVDVQGSALFYNGTQFATFAGGSGSNALLITFASSAATAAAISQLINQIAFHNVTDDPGSGTRSISWYITDGDGGTSNLTTATVTVAVSDDAPAAVNDVAATPETSAVNIDVVANDVEPDGPAKQIAEIAGVAVVAGDTVNLSGGATAKLENDGTITYNPNGKFNTLTDNTSGAVNTSANDVFTYKLAGAAGTANVTVTVNGVVSPEDLLMGDGGNNTINGTPNRDIFLVQQGGNDTVNGNGGNDTFYFGNAFTAADTVNGGDGADAIILQGNYSVTFGSGTTSNISGLESISLAPGNITDFGDTSNQFYDYNLTTIDANVGAGGLLKFNGHHLRAGEDFTFNGSLESNGRFFIFAGLGVDNLTGGAGNDIFVFGHDGRFGSSDVVHGGGGYDSIYLRGDYSLDFTAGGFTGSITGVESITLGWAADTQFIIGGDGEFDYNIVWDDAMLADDGRITINGSGLAPNETMVFNGADEVGGDFRLWGGAAFDELTGGGGNDLIYGGLGADSMRGNGGNDTFRYHSVDESIGDRDGIQDFSQGDLIDLSIIDAREATAIDDAFIFIGDDPFVLGEAGRVRATMFAGPIWLVQADTDGDAVADLEFFVTLTNVLDPLTAADFIL